MEELTYRDAVTRAIAQEMARDEDVVLLGEDIAAAGGVFKTTVGLFERFGPKRVRDTPIAEQAILGAAMGAAMTGLRPIAEIMFSDFLAVCWDIVANQMAKMRYMTNGQVSLPLVIRTANGAGSRFGAQHSQSVENWAMMVPGLKVVAPSTPADVIGLFAAAVRDPTPFCSSNTSRSTAPRVWFPRVSWSISSARPRCCARAAMSPWWPWRRWCRAHWRRLSSWRPITVLTRRSWTFVHWCRSIPQLYCTRSNTPAGW
jgi:transketolase C-terminal domain/subunit